MDRKEIHAQGNGVLSADERLELARLLIKAGYSVRLTRKVPPNGKTYVHVVEYWNEERNRT